MASREKMALETKLHVRQGIGAQIHLDGKNQLKIWRIPVKMGPSTAVAHLLNQNVLSKSMYSLPQALSYCLSTTKWRQTTATIWNYLCLSTAFTIETKIQKMCYK